MTIVRFLLSVLPSRLTAASRFCTGAALSSFIVALPLFLGLSQCMLKEAMRLPRRSENQ
jgi:hypothetical protein